MKIRVLSGRASRQSYSLFMKVYGYWTRTAVRILDRIVATESDSFYDGLLPYVTMEWESETLFAVLFLPNQFSPRTVCRYGVICLQQPLNILFQQS
jgi:hypothetical protein